MPQVFTYHCICSSLLLATTHDIATLPTRQPPIQDKAIILPLPPSPSPESKKLSDFGYTILLSITADARATIIRRLDGFEKRYLRRCGRCRVVLGYTLDEAHFAIDERGFDRRGSRNGVEDSLAHGNDAVEVGRRGSEVKILYLLPRGLMSTEDMAQGKIIAVED